MSAARVRLGTLVLLGLSIPLAQAQSLQVAVVNGSQSSVLGIGGSYAMSANGVGQWSLVWVYLRDVAAASVTVTNLTLAGSSDFSLANLPSLPDTIPSGATVNFSLRFQPSSAVASSAILTISANEPTGPVVYWFNLLGSAPNLSLAYFIAPNGQ